MRFYQFSKPVILHASGPDSSRYLNARLTNDFAALDAGAHMLAACLTSQGKTQALFTVYKLGANDALLICDGGERDKVIEAFKQFIVADQVTVADQSEQYELFHLYGSISDIADLMCGLDLNAVPDTTPKRFTQRNGAIALNRTRSTVPGIDLLTTKQQSAAERLKLAGATPLTHKEYTLERIKAGTPSFPDEINESHLFQESGLNQAISFTKGCYVGQEVIEKVDSHGKLAFKLCAVFFLAEQTEIEDPTVYCDSESTQKAGQIITHCYDEAAKQIYAFVRVRNADEDVKLFVESKPCTSV